MTPFAAKYQLERDLRPFTRAEVRKLPSDRAGLYALWLPGAGVGAGECLYVGMSGKCVRERLLQHLSSEENPELRRELELFGVEPTRIEFGTAWASDEAEARALESAVIEEWRPRTNRRG